MSGDVCTCIENTFCMCLQNVGKIPQDLIPFDPKALILILHNVPPPIWRSEAVAPRAYIWNMPSNINRPRSAAGLVKECKVIRGDHFQEGRLKRLERVAAEKAGIRTECKMSNFTVCAAVPRLLFYYSEACTCCWFITRQCYFWSCVGGE